MHTQRTGSPPFTDVSCRNGLVGAGVAAFNQVLAQVTIGSTKCANAHLGELPAVNEVLGWIEKYISDPTIAPEQETDSQDCIEYVAYRPPPFMNGFRLLENP